LKKKKVMSIFGTRPDAVKMAPLVNELRKYEEIDSIVCVTAQHRSMLDQILNIFKIDPHYDLNIMKERQSLEDITIRALEGLGKVLEETRPDIVLVHGDTTTCFVGSLAAFYKKIAVGHVEAGLRTFDKYSPYPEEMNRRLTGVMSDIHFAPTVTNKQNLINEGVGQDNIFITGNTVIDALNTTIRKDYVFQNSILQNIDFKNSRVLTVTAHRRENLGTPLTNICKALLQIAEKYRTVEIVYAVHLNPVVQGTARSILGNHDRIHLVDPLGLEDMHNLMDRSYFILTDSGGIQEEAPALGKPVLVLRNETERPEAVESGTVKVVGTSQNKIFNGACQLLDNDLEYSKMAKAVNPYGDGRASERIAKALLYKFGITDSRPEDFIP
jgi:UDP-N-acetylglucosamine 2-epimerase